MRKRTRTYDTELESSYVGREVVLLHGEDEVRKAREKARADFLLRCQRQYGMIPFTDTYLERTWPST
jgi:hypothetical protein